MSVILTGPQLRQILLGQKVVRAAGNLPQSTTGNIFTITGGSILVTGIIGTVTTIIQAQATATKLVSVPTTGPSTDMAAAITLNGNVVGTVLGWAGLASEALIAGGSATLPRSPVVAQVGAIGVNTGASSTGQIQWTLSYIPWDDNAVVVAA